MKLTSLDQLASVTPDQLEDFNLFIEGLIDLKNTFAPILDFTEGEQLISDLEGILVAHCPVDAVVNVEEDAHMDTEAIFAPTPTPTDPIAVTTQGGGNMNALITALKNHSYSVSDDLNGEIFHIIENHLKADVNTLTVEQLVMALNMCRVVRNGKEARLTKKDRVDLYTLHPLVTAGTKKAASEDLTAIEIDLEETHGKYATKAKLSKTRYDTSAAYGDDWMVSVTSFSGTLNQGVTLASISSAPAPEPEPAPSEDITPDPVEMLSPAQVKAVESVAGLPLDEIKSSPAKCREVANKLAGRVNVLESKAKTTAKEDREIHDKTYATFTMDLQAKVTADKPRSALDRFMGK
jgi:hypothetical protein